MAESKYAMAARMGIYDISIRGIDLNPSANDARGVQAHTKIGSWQAVVTFKDAKKPMIKAIRLTPDAAISAAFDLLEQFYANQKAPVFSDDRPAVPGKEMPKPTKTVKDLLTPERVAKALAEQAAAEEADDGMDLI